MQNARKEVMRLMREDFDPTPPGWDGPSGEWDDNAEDVADEIIAAVLSEKPTHASDAWQIVKQWLSDYAAEEAAFSRYADNVMLDGVMTAGLMRALNDALYVDAEAARQAKLIKVNAGERARKRYDRLMQSFTELQAAAQKVIDETNRIHDGDPYPIKYRAPYGAIAELSELLGKQRGLR